MRARRNPPPPSSCSVGTTSLRGQAHIDNDSNRAKVEGKARRSTSKRVVSNNNKSIVLRTIGNAAISEHAKKGRSKKSTAKTSSVGGVSKTNVQNRGGKRKRETAAKRSSCGIGDSKNGRIRKDASRQPPRKKQKRGTSADTNLSTGSVGHIGIMQTHMGSPVPSTRSSAESTKTRGSRGRSSGSNSSTGSSISGRSTIGSRGRNSTGSQSAKNRSSSKDCIEDNPIPVANICIDAGTYNERLRVDDTRYPGMSSPHRASPPRFFSTSTAASVQHAKVKGVTEHMPHTLSSPSSSPNIITGDEPSIINKHNGGGIGRWFGRLFTKLFGR